MTTDPFTDAARAYAREQADENYPLEYESKPDAFTDGIEIGAEWARDHLAAREPTEAEVEAVAVHLADIPLQTWNNTILSDEFKDSTREKARAALAAAKEARR